jgi:hypothetical protein
MAVTRHTYQHTLLQNARTLRPRKVIASLDPPSRLSARRKRVHQPLLSLSAENKPIQLAETTTEAHASYISPMVGPETSITSNSDGILNPISLDEDKNTNIE